MFDLWNCFEELGENSLFLKWGRGEEKLRVKSLTSKNAYSSSEICILPKNFTSRRNNSIPQYPWGYSIPQYPWFWAIIQDTTSFAH